jgi:hypothetical protein
VSQQLPAGAWPLPFQPQEESIGGRGVGQKKWFLGWETIDNVVLAEAASSALDS